MKVCSKCGVELDDEMSACPLCDTIVSGDIHRSAAEKKESYQAVDNDRKDLMQRILWQITIVLLSSGILATLIINLSINGKITWSIYPITICLILVGYVSLLAFWRTRIILKLLSGWLIAVILLLIINRFTGADWPVFLALPLVSSVNVIAILLIVVLTRLKTKGLNVLAIIFVSLAILVLMIESVVSWYVKGSTMLGWSVIVAACLLSVTAVILFMYFRTRNSAELKKIFHT